VAGLTLDSGALIAYERGEAQVRAWLTEAFERGTVPTVPSVVVAETWRGGARSARVAKLLKGCVVESLDQTLARAAGLLLARCSAQTTDAIVVASAARRGDVVLTSDPSDLATLATGTTIRVERI
jgi:predicted nucleic acid-binding protein